MITLLTIMGLLFTGFLIIVMGISIQKFGDLISDTPDMLERHGERKQRSNAPSRHANYFVMGFVIIFSIGATGVILSNNTYELIIGGIMILSSLLFSATVLFYSMQIYNLMRKNAVELKDSVVA